MANPNQASETIQLMRDKGIHFAIDDFGTGYSSLSYLKQFPIDSLKIDRSFVKNTFSNEDDQNIIKTIVAMASSLNMNTVAEGVENKDQHEFLISQGCQTIQGYYHGRPISAQKFEALLDGLRDGDIAGLWGCIQRARHGIRTKIQQIKELS